MQKITFNDKFGLTQAVLEGRKTMERRLINASPIDEDYINRVCDLDLCVPYIAEKYGKYKIDETVAVAQSYNEIYEELKRTHGSSSSVTRDFFHKYIQGGRMPVSNKKLVKAEAMLHRIRITGIKVEKLRDISDEDCLREGIIIEHPTDRYYRYGFTHSGSNYHISSEAFAVLIDKVSGKGTWDSNPYVFAYTFELVK